MPNYKQGPYYGKKVISLAPDALVYINGKESVTTCVKCRKGSSVIDDIIELSVSVSLEATNSASFTIVAPQYDKTRWDSRGNPRIKPMFEVEIFMRGRFLVNDEPRYYPVFWGIVTSVDAAYSDGQNSLKVNCEGILRWWEMTKINVQPAIVDQTVHSDKANPSPWTNIFGEMNPYDIIWNLATISTGGLMAPQAFDGSYRNEVAIDSSLLDSQDTDIMKYWQDRFVQVGKALRIFGFKGERQDPALAVEASKSAQDKRAVAVSSLAAERRVEKQKAKKGKKASREGVTAEDIEAFRPFGQVSKGFDLFASEMTSKLDMANQVKNTINYEFYQDTTGELIFKPPFYNIDVRPFPPYKIEPSDIINMNITEAESEVITRVDVKGSIHHLLIDAGDPSLQPYGFYVDPDLATKFGLRQATITMNYLDTSADCFAYAVGELDRLNKRRCSGSLTIMGRPELRVGFPIYVSHRDTFYYVTSVAHSFSFGGTFTTTLGLEAVRRKRYEEERGKPTDTVMPNRIHKGETSRSTYRNPGEKERIEAKLIQNKAETDVSVRLKDQKNPPGTKKLENRSLGVQVVGTIASVFEIMEDPSITRVTLEDNGRILKAPLTDREGYEVVGGYEYGRNLIVSPRGDLQYMVPNIKTFHVTTVGSLSTSVEESENPTGNQQIRYGSTAQVGNTQLSMEPRGKGGEVQVKELAPSADPTIETQNKAVTKRETREPESILSLEPGLRRGDIESKCTCHRLDRKIDPILRKKSLKGKEAPARGSTQLTEEQRNQQRVGEINARLGELTNSPTKLTPEEQDEVYSLLEELEGLGG